MVTRLFYLGVLVIFFSGGCEQRRPEALFTRLHPDVSGIDFNNVVNETDSTHSFINEFGYMGGGVGIGDFNNDGLKDIYFTGNQVSSRLYINKGGNKFEDITLSAGVGTSVWASGVTIADVNADGYDDIYVSVFGRNLLERSANLLFINQHNLTFRECAAEYGLADTGYSTQAVFLDYDKDGDLDMYLANYLLNASNANTIFPRDRTGRSSANDRLYRNDGGKFTDVSMEAGIKEDGYGLGVVVSDFNNDSWPDIYVANDFLSNDVLWLNNQDGTFTNSIARALRHQSYSSMGADAADINNDGLTDIVTLDMMPEDNERRKLTFSFQNYERYEAERAMGYEPEFMRNMLQLNNGVLADGLPYFSEIGQLAGISNTDWSWSVLMADFDNDGWKDMHVTNGVGRDFINADFLEFSSIVMSKERDPKKQRALINNKLASLKHVELKNYLYLNKGDYTFRNIADSAGLGEKAMSNGAAWVDLDNDGDWDLVVNNINKEAFVYINNTVGKHYIGIELKGDSLNRYGYGAKVFVYNNGQVQVQEQNPVRGYFSTVDHKLLFGLGNLDHADSIVVVWPDNRMQVITGMPADTVLVLDIQHAREQYQAPVVSPVKLFSQTRITGRHVENPYNDFAFQRLLPQKYSQLGPFIATGDVDNDGLTDFFTGGGFNFSGRVYVQQKDGRFISSSLVDSIKMEEDLDCVFFDADGDGDQDLLVAGGDIRFEENSVYNKPRLYLNDGRGKFSLDPGAIPNEIGVISGCVRAGDFDGDGQPDLFIGSRVTKRYPLPGRSYLLKNNKGVFRDVTAEVCPSLAAVGMVTSALWIDVDKDNKLDFVVAGEWMPVRFFKNTGGRLTEFNTGLPNMHGMWRSLAAADIDHDGDLDIVAGNLGLNCDYQVTAQYPMKLYATDLDGNGSIDPVPFYHIPDASGEKRLYPGINRKQFADQVPAIKKQFYYHADFAKATADDIFKGKDHVQILLCDEIRSCWLENTGNGRFVKHILPMEAQFAPVNAIVCEDMDGDGVVDLLLAGNEYQADVMMGRYDASYGCFLKGSSGGFTAVPGTVSGFVLNGDVKDLAVIPGATGGKLVVASVNDDSLRVFSVREAKGVARK
jgi:ASPIC and UnbV.